VIPILVMVILHSGAGTPVEVNPLTITNLRNPEPSNTKLFTPNVRCQINMTDGKYVTVKETCAEVRKLMETTK
jgi:hypothetical protein